MEVTAMILQRFGLLLLSLVVLIAGCPGSSSKEESFNIKIQNRTVTDDMALIRVNRGEMVTLWWTTDELTRIHLHGYDIQQIVKPGVPTVFTFEANASGRYPITAHGFGETALGKSPSETTLVYLEVLP